MNTSNNTLSPTIARRPFDPAVFKKEARQALLGHTGTISTAALLCSLIRVLLTQVTAGLVLHNPVWALLLACFVQFLLLTLTGLLEIGLNAIAMDLVFAEETVSLRSLFTPFRENTDTCIRVRAFFSLLDVLFFLPANALVLWLPGSGLMDYFLPVFAAMAVGYLLRYAASFVYGIASCLVLDFQDLGALEVLRKTRALLRGHYRDLLHLYLSFLPQFLEGVLSFGIGFLWVGGYFRTARAFFYKELLG